MTETERKDRLFRNLQKLEAYRLLQNEMGRAVAAFNFRQAEKLLGFFALDRADVSLEYCDEGRFTGPELVARIIREVVGAEVQPGEMLDLQLTTPMIEVAEDGNTAKCLWWTCGIGAQPRPEQDPQPIWAWGQLAVDFIREGESWKIWHLHYFRYIKCDYHKGWVEDTSMRNRLQSPLHPGAETCSYHNPYGPQAIREALPCPPKPYATYTDRDRFWELDRNKNW